MNTQFLGKRSNLGAAVLVGTAVLCVLVLAGCTEKKPTGPSQYTLTLISDPAPAGIFTPEERTFDPGTVVNVRVTPAKEGKYIFTNWEGDASGTTNSVTITMDKDKTLTAVFEEKFAVTLISVPAKGGTITPDPDSRYYTKGTPVELTATAKSGYEFSGWEHTASQNNVVLPRVNSDTTFTAIFKRQYKFDPSEFTILTRNDDGDYIPCEDGCGTVKIEPAIEDGKFYLEGDEITVIPLAEPRVSFRGWQKPDGTKTNATETYTITVGEDAYPLWSPIFY